MEGESEVVNATTACKTWIYYMFVALCLLAQSKHILRMNPGIFIMKGGFTNERYNFKFNINATNIR